VADGRIGDRLRVYFKAMWLPAGVREDLDRLFSQDLADNWPEIKKRWLEVRAIYQSQPRGFVLGPVLVERLSSYPASRPLLEEGLSDKDPIIAGYCALTLIRMGAKKDTLKKSGILERQECVEVHLGCFSSDQILGEFVKELLSEETGQSR
jgi:hypothetical protein